MGFGIGHPSLAAYRMVKGGDSGLNLSLVDLYGQEIELPSLYEIIKSFFTRKPLKARIKGFSSQMIRQLQAIQKKIDDKVQEEIRKAKSKAGG